ncbi:MAG: tRNA-dihydrouridine synthase family protein [Microgenomates group bacterium]
MSFRDFIHSQKIIGLSPMDGITDCAYRQTQCFVKQPDVIFTEFVSAEGISRGGVKLYDQLLYEANERPIVGQIFGKDPPSFYRSAIILCYLGFEGIDINMGCPAKTVTQHGSGAALIEKPDIASQIINSTRQGIDDYFSGKVSILDIGLKQSSLDVIHRNLTFSNYSPLVKEGLGEIEKPTLSVKTRVGITENVVSTWIPHLLSHHLDFITLHGRTLKQGYSGLADWQAIRQATELAHQSKTLLWGNGDIDSLALAHQKISEFGVDGVLIGRASMGNPWVFSDTIPSLQDKFSLMCYHADQFSRIFPHRRLDPLRHHFILYCSGHPRAKQLREKVIRLNTLAELYALEEDFLTC